MPGFLGFRPFELGQIVDEGAAMFLFVAEMVTARSWVHRIHFIAEIDDFFVPARWRNFLGFDHARITENEIGRVLRGLEIFLVALQFERAGTRPPTTLMRFASMGVSDFFLDIGPERFLDFLRPPRPIEDRRNWRGTF